MDHSLAFDLNLAQRKELLRVLESTNMAGDVREFFVDLGLEDNRRFLSLGEAGSAGAHARMVYTAAQDGSTYSNWFAGLVKIGGVLSINSLSNAGLAPVVKPPNPAHSRGWVPNRPITPLATQKPKSPSDLPPVRTITLNNGRVIRLSSQNATFVRGNLQSPTIPRMVKVNGKWVRVNPTVITSQMEHKILEGQRRTPNSTRLIGGHSPVINNSNPNFARQTIGINPDGTRWVLFTKQFPDGNLATIKKSNLFPNNWSNEKIIESTRTIGNSPPSGVRLHDGATWHRGIINGVEIDVIKIDNKVISSYPTGTINAPAPKGFE